VCVCVCDCKAWITYKVVSLQAAGDLDRLWEAAQAYMDARPRKQQPGLAPFFAANGPEDAAAQCALRSEGCLWGRVSAGLSPVCIPSESTMCVAEMSQAPWVEDFVTSWCAHFCAPLTPKRHWKPG